MTDPLSPEYLARLRLKALDAINCTLADERVKVSICAPSTVVALVDEVERLRAGILQAGRSIAALKPNPSSELWAISDLLRDLLRLDEKGTEREECSVAHLVWSEAEGRYVAGPCPRDKLVPVERCERCCKRPAKEEGLAYCEPCQDHDYLHDAMDQLGNFGPCPPDVMRVLVALVRFNDDRMHSRGLDMPRAELRQAVDALEAW